MAQWIITTHFYLAKNVECALEMMNELHSEIYCAPHLLLIRHVLIINV